jgi:hypothetical protein
VRFHDGNLQAWLTAWMDIVMWWNPFHFYATIGASVGASYKMDLLFTSKTFKVELGADLRLWGPETGGTARIHWWVISFTIDFGAGAPAPMDEAQTWDQFTKVLPDASDATKILPVKGLTPSQPANGQIDGLSTVPQADRQSEPDPTAKWAVRSDGFQFTTHSAIPISHLYVGDQPKTLYASGATLNIRPMRRQGLDFFTQIYILRADGSEVNLLDPNHPWILEENRANLPTALWGSGGCANPIAGEQQLIEDQLVGLTITAPAPVNGYTPGNIDINEALRYDPLEPGTNPLRSGLQPSGPVPAPGDRTIALIAKVMDPDVKANRDGIFNSLTSLKVNRGANDSLADLAAAAGTLFSAEPLLINGNSLWRR